MSRLDLVTHIFMQRENCTSFWVALEKKSGSYINKNATRKKAQNIDSKCEILCTDRVPYKCYLQCAAYQCYRCRTESAHRSHSARHFSFFSALWLLDQLLLLLFFYLTHTFHLIFLFSIRYTDFANMCTFLPSIAFLNTATDAIKPTIITWTVCCFFFHFCCCFFFY